MLHGVDPHELQVLSEKLLMLSSRVPPCARSGPAGFASPGLPNPSPLAFAKAICQLRHRRSDYFSDCSFGEPAWDMLLDLYVGHHEGKVARTTGLCAASLTPTSTGLRYIALLERLDLARREADGEDQRVTNVTLSAKGLAMMDEFLTTMLARFTSTLFEGCRATLHASFDEPSPPAQAQQALASQRAGNGDLPLR